MSIDILRLIFVKQFGEGFPLFNETDEYHMTSPLKTSEVLNVYARRYEEYKTDKGKVNVEYESLLKSLSEFQGPAIIIHGITNENGVTLFFTDESVSFIIGVLFSPVRDKNDFSEWKESN